MLRDPVYRAIYDAVLHFGADGDPEAFAALRRGPDTLLEACRARDGEAAERATRDALVWVLAELQRMLDKTEAPAA